MVPPFNPPMTHSATWNTNLVWSSLGCGYVAQYMLNTCMQAQKKRTMDWFVFFSNLPTYHHDGVCNFKCALSCMIINWARIIPHDYISRLCTFKILLNSSCHLSFQGDGAQPESMIVPQQPKLPGKLEHVLHFQSTYYEDFVHLLMMGKKCN